jgi:hypothetical protein
VPQLDRDGDVHVLDLGDTENRFNPDSLAALDALLTRSRPRPRRAPSSRRRPASSGPTGLDLEWVGRPSRRERRLRRHGARAARPGGCLPGALRRGAAGAHVRRRRDARPLAHDARVMRGDRGYFCLPEVDIQIPFTPGMAGLIQARLTPQAAHEAMTTGRRYGGATPSPPGSSTRPPTRTAARRRRRAGRCAGRQARPDGGRHQAAGCTRRAAAALREACGLRDLGSARRGFRATAAVADVRNRSRPGLGPQRHSCTSTRRDRGSVGPCTPSHLLAGSTTDRAWARNSASSSTCRGTPQLLAVHRHRVGVEGRRRGRGSRRGADDVDAHLRGSARGCPSRPGTRFALSSSAVSSVG